MAKFRSNHSRQGKSAGGGTTVKVGIFAAIVGGLFYVFNYFTGNKETTDDTEVVDDYLAEDYYLPRGGDYQIINYGDFALAYDEEHEQPAWAGYILTRENLDKEWNERNDNFRSDSRVMTGSASPSDYRNSGYDRGHIVPAADMAWNATSQDLTFLMSNISPQSHHFNTGIWRELEETVRTWAKRYKQVYVVTGPMLNREPKGMIGKENEVSIPAAYFKVVLDLTEPEMKAIGFIMPNEISYEPLFKYVATVDAIEEETGLNFFAELMPGDLEEKLESNVNIDLWTFSKKKYDQRVSKWNKG